MTDVNVVRIIIGLAVAIVAILIMVTRTKIHVFSCYDYQQYNRRFDWRITG